MKILDANGNDPSKPKTIVNGAGQELSSKPPEQMTTRDVGKHIAADYINKAMKEQSNALVNNKFDILYHMALHILSHRIVNIGLGMEDAIAVAEWDSSRAFAAEKDVQEHLTATVEEWKTDYLNGELAYHPSKPT